MLFPRIGEIASRADEEYRRAGQYDEAVAIHAKDLAQSRARE